MGNRRLLWKDALCLLALSLLLSVASPVAVGKASVGSKEFFAISSKISTGNSRSFVRSSTGLDFLLLSDYNRTLNIGESFLLVAVSYSGERVKFRSSKSSVAAVNSYGEVTAKRSGTVSITAKTKGAEAICRVRVRKTCITLNRTELSLEHGESFRLSAKVSSKGELSYRSSKSSVVTVDDDGKLYALKPGEALITVKADGSSAFCRVIVKQPEITLNRTQASLYRGQEVQLSAEVSSGIAPVWKSSKSGVAVVDETGRVTALKNGTALITAKVDGISRSCEVVVKKPEISLSTDYLEIKCGKSAKITATVSSGNKPTWTSGNSSIISVNDNGRITSHKKGKTYVTVSEDGTKVRCRVVVLDNSK